MTPITRTIVSILIAILIAAGIRTYFLQPFIIKSDSMAPALMKGDKVFVDKNVYKKTEPKRDDIVVYIPPQQPNKKFIQRIVGLPNEILEIKEGQLFINGTAVGKRQYESKGDFIKSEQSIRIPDDCYFVLGDNSSSSLDSRYWGFLPRKNIIGKATRIFFPLSRFGAIK